MNIEKAIRYAMGGYKIKRKAWVTDEFLLVTVGGRISAYVYEGGSQLWNPTCAEVLALDWEVVQ